MLANMDGKEIQDYLEHQELRAFTENSITDKEQLYQELIRTRQRGYAVDDMEHEFGIKCIAMPIFNRSGELYASISISGLATHFSDENISKWAILLKKYVRIIESRL